MSPPITIKLWNGEEAVRYSPLAAVKAAIRLWEANPVHPGRPGVSFYVDGVHVRTVSSLPQLKRAVEKKA